MTWILCKAECVKQKESEREKWKKVKRKSEEIWRKCFLWKIYCGMKSNLNGNGKKRVRGVCVWHITSVINVKYNRDRIKRKKCDCEFEKKIWKSFFSGKISLFNNIKAFYSIVQDKSFHVCPWECTCERKWNVYIPLSNQHKIYVHSLYVPN